MIYNFVDVYLKTDSINVSKTLLTRGERALVPLFNGISTFQGYLLPKPFLYKNRTGTGKGVYIFPKSRSKKLNEIVKLDFELVYFPQNTTA